MRRLLKRVLKRGLWSLLILVGVATLSFVIARGLPGDPTRMLLGPQASAADLRQARKAYGLDRSTAEQYGLFWRQLLHGPQQALNHSNCETFAGIAHINLGYSYRYRQPVVRLIAKKAPKSLQLALAAVFLQLLLGLGVGIVAARNRNGPIDDAAIGLLLVGVSAPTFVLGLALQWLFAHKLGWLPFDGYGSTNTEQWVSLILPALTLGVYGAALYARLAREELYDALHSDYARTAKAKGASPLRVTVVHALRNAMLPLATLMVLDFGALVGGAIVTEKLFRWPGMGAMAVDAMVNRDGPVIMGTILFSATAIALAASLIDVLQHTLSPPQDERPSEQGLS